MGAQVAGRHFHRMHAGQFSNPLLDFQPDARHGVKCPDRAAHHDSEYTLFTLFHALAAINKIADPHRHFVAVSDRNGVTAVCSARHHHVFGFFCETR